MIVGDETHGASSTGRKEYAWIFNIFDIFFPAQTLSGMLHGK